MQSASPRNISAHHSCTKTALQHLNTRKCHIRLQNSTTHSIALADLKK